MENKIYYGEYSLKHWIDLMLSKKVELPSYQRIFRWDEKQVLALLSALNENLYIPTVTIGAYWEGESLHNLIIDGQQRLTSILLGLLEIFPEKNYFNKIDDVQLNEDAEDEGEVTSNFLEWKYEELLDLGSDIETIRFNAEKKGYSPLKNAVYNDDFFEEHYLGFSYIVPVQKNRNAIEQQKYYSSVFRNINQQGISLDRLEIRESLYFNRQEWIPVFKPERIGYYKIDGKKIDFVRYLALASQYAKDRDSQKLIPPQRGCSRTDFEKYCTEYLEAVFNRDNDMFCLFQDNKDAESRIQKLIAFFDENQIPKNFSSLIEADLYFLGGSYFFIFTEKIKKCSSFSENLMLDVKTEIENIRNDVRHAKNPNYKKYIRFRMEKSIEIWGKYVCDKTR